jgi:AcrR family transcriptional regulator
MRTKSESRRKIILDTAFQVFLESGFSAASMSEIAARVGGSKATLYSYFTSKEELFVAVIRQFADDQFNDLRILLDPDKDLGEALVQFGTQFLSLLSHPDLIRMHRTVFAEAGHSSVGHLFYSRAPLEMIRDVSAFLQDCMNQGRLRHAASLVAAHHLIGLLRAETMEELLYGYRNAVSAEEIEAAAKRAVEVFLRGYAPDL